MVFGDPTFSSTSYMQDNLIAGPFQLISEGRTLTGLGVLTAGTLLNGTAVASTGSGIDGVLAVDVDTTGGVTVPVYITGEFNIEKLTSAEGTGSSNVSAYKDEAHGKSIFFKSSVQA